MPTFKEVDKPHRFRREAAVCGSTMRASKRQNFLHKSPPPVRYCRTTPTHRELYLLFLFRQPRECLKTFVAVVFCPDKVTKILFQNNFMRFQLEALHLKTVEILKKLLKSLGFFQWHFLPSQPEFDLSLRGLTSPDRVS